MEQTSSNERRLLSIKSAILESPEGIIVFALDKNYCYLDFTLSHKQTMKTIWGVDIDIGTNMLDCITSEHDKLQAKKNFDRAISGERFVLSEEYGDEKFKRTYYENRYAPLLDDPRHIMGVTVFVIDITKLKRAEDALIESEKKYRTIFEDSQDAIFICSSAGTFLDLNPAGLHMFGFSSLEEIRKVIIPRDLYQDPDAWIEKKKCLQQSGSIKDFKLFLKKKDGTELTVMESSTAITDKEGNIIASRGIMRDVTEKLRMREQLMLSQKMESLGTLAGGIAHDFNNILTAILGYSQIVLRLTEPDSTIHKAVGEINTAGMRARDLAKQILAFSRKAPATKQPMLIQPIIKETVKLLSATLPSSISIRQDTDSHCGEIMANPVQIHQVLMNLCTNAIHSLDQDEGEITISLKEATLSQTQAARLLLPAGRYVLLAVNDNGKGIKPEHLSRIFEPFFSTKGPEQGTGMGLSVVHGIIKDSDGAITVKSQKNTGTLFQTYFPLFSNNSHNSAPEPPPLIARHCSARILFVDDEEQLRLISKTILEDIGCKVTVAANGAEAWRIFIDNTNEFDLVITDTNMPEISGPALIKKIRAVQIDLPIILCSGNQTRITPTLLEQVLIDKFLAKPYTFDDLTQAIHEILTANTQKDITKSEAQ